MDTLGKNEFRKSVLMFCPTFFGYEKRVAEAIRAQGFDVDLYDERPGNSFFHKVCLRLNLKIYKPVVQRYLKKIIEKNNGKQYDYVFVVKSEAAGKKEVELLRKAYPNAEFILYFWDSVENVPDGEKKIGLYDRVLTFDPFDAEAYGLKLRPLFFQKAYEAEYEQKADYRYDVAFIGTAHTARPRIMKQLQMQCKQRGKDSFSYLFLPHPFVYLYNKLLNPDYKDIRKADIHFDSISPSRIKEIYSESRCILDVEHSDQRGLTMRTIEMIGLHKKLITTNQNIAKYDFYDENNICVINKENPVVPEAFWNSPYVPVKQEILQKYSLRSFVQEIFDIRE